MSFWLTEKIVAVGLARIHCRTVSIDSFRTSGLLRHRCTSPFVRFPLMSGKYSGWLVNSAGGTSESSVWQNAPYVAVLLLAGLRSLPSEPVEAASIDGASRLQVFWHITLPLLKPYILVALLLRTIFEFRAFDNIYVMTSGGPANATMSLSMFTYLASFVRFDLSLGAAASWLMLVMCLMLCVFFILVIRRREAN